MEKVKKNKEAFLSIPERQSPIAIVLILFRFVRLVVRQLLPFLIILFINPSAGSDSWWTIGLSILLGTTTLLSIISYFKFYYYIKDEELIIERGLFQKKKLNVPFDRIQTINFNQNIVHRFFNVVELEIDTAGSSGKEFTISALSKDKAERIRSYLLSQKKELLESNESSIQQAQTLDTRPDQLLLHLNVGDLIKVGLGQNHIRSLGIIVGTVFGWLQFAEDALGKKQYQAYEREYFAILLQSFSSIIVFVLIIAFCMTIISTVIRYYDFNFFQTFQGFKIQTGLFTRTENSAKMSKIQFVRWTTNPIKKLFKLFNLQLYQAASSALSRRQSILVPGCYTEQIQTVCLAYFPEEPYLDFEQHTIHPRIMLRSIFSYGVIPCIIYFILKMPLDTWSWLYLSLWFLFVVLMSYVHYRKWKFAISTAGVRTTNGLFSTTHTLLKWYKIQSVKLRQTIFQKRRGLTDIYFFTAAGTIRIPYIPEEKAVQVKNFVLYKIESSQQTWM